MMSGGIITLANELREKYGDGAAAMADGLALAQISKGDHDMAARWKQIASAVRELGRPHPSPLLRKSG